MTFEKSLWVVFILYRDTFFVLLTLIKSLVLHEDTKMLIFWKTA